MTKCSSCSVSPRCAKLKLLPNNFDVSTNEVIRSLFCLQYFVLLPQVAKNLLILVKVSLQSGLLLPLSCIPAVVTVGKLNFITTNRHDDRNNKNEARVIKLYYFLCTVTVMLALPRAQYHYSTVLYCTNGTGIV